MKIESSFLTNHIARNKSTNMRLPYFLKTNKSWLPSTVLLQNFSSDPAVLKHWTFSHAG